MELGNVGQWVGATATSLAVLVALFKEQIVYLVRKPKLNLSVTLDPPHCHKTIITTNIQKITFTMVKSECYYLRLWIENSGKTRAKDVQVFVSEVFKKSADTSFKKVDDFLPMNLVWSHGYANSGAQEIFADGISPKMGKHCDLGHIVDPAHRKDFGYDLPAVAEIETILTLDVEFKANTLSYMLVPGVYKLALKIAASNCEPITKEIEISLPGKWYTDQKQMFHEGLGIRVIK